MFGFIAANLSDLDDAERLRYRAAYCGLCSALKERHGQLSRFSLTYDMAFLVLLLGSLYEPPEQTGEERCPAHPLKPHRYMRTRFTDYAADLSVALAYHKCLDDWNDDRSLRGRVYASLLEKEYVQVKQRIPRQCKAIEDGLAAITRIEQAALSGSGRTHDKARADASSEISPDVSPDAAANRFGDLLGELFVFEDDVWADALRGFGGQLGRFIYFMDAACDLPDDLRKGSYNPLAGLELDEAGIRTALETFAGRAAALFEKLPLEQDLHLLRSVLYSGIWQKRNAQLQKRGASSRTAAGDARPAPHAQEIMDPQTEKDA